MPFDPDAYLQGQSDTQGFDPDAYLSQPPADYHTKTSEPAAPPPTWLGAAKGVGEAGLALGSGTLRAVTGAVNDLLPEAIGGPGSRAAIAAKIARDPVLNYQPGSEAAPIMSALGTVAKPINKAVSYAHDVIAGVGGERAAQVAGDIATLGASYGMAGGLGEPTKATSSTQKAVADAQELGYVVPPATANPNAINNMVEGLAGKASTAQLASMKNQEVTNNLVRSELKLPADAPLNTDTLDAVRAQQGAAYDAVAQVPNIKFGTQYEKELDALGATSKKISAALPNYKSTGSAQIQELIDSLKPQGGVMDGETAVELSKSLRSEASGYQAAADRMGDPQARMLARAYRGSAEAVENAVENHLTSIGQPELAANWDAARTNIAKTYSVQNALDGAGNVDALKLGKQLLKGKPLSGNLEAAANFANAFPRVARNIKESSPGMSPLDVYAGAAIEAATGHPEALAIGPGRMLARSALLSPVGQAMARKSTVPSTLSGLAIGVTPGVRKVVPPVATEEQNQ